MYMKLFLLDRFLVYYDILYDILELCINFIQIVITRISAIISKQLHGMVHFKLLSA